MKKALFLLCTLSVPFLIISSCGKKTDNGVYIAPGTNGNGVNPGNPNGNGTSNGGTITATINGNTLFTSTSVSYETNGPLSGFAAVEGTTSELVLSVDNDSVGVHKMNILTDVLYTASASLSYGSSYGTFPGLGSVNITSNTGTTISGTFSCSLYNMSNSADSIKLTNGVFTSLAY